jgi:hypothetical protein
MTTHVSEWDTSREPLKSLSVRYVTRLLQFAPDPQQSRRFRRDDFACPIPLAHGKQTARMSQAETVVSRKKTEVPALLDASPIFLRVSVAEKARAEAEARRGGFRSVADWARQKLFYGWKKPGDKK